MFTSVAQCLRDNSILPRKTHASVEEIRKLTRTGNSKAQANILPLRTAHSGAKSKNPGQKSIFFSEPNYDFLNDRYPEHKKKG